MITDTTTEKTIPRGADVCGVVGLLGHVGRGVIAGQRVLGVEQPDQRSRRAGSRARSDPATPGSLRRSGVVDERREDRPDVGPAVLVEHDSDEDDRRDADDVPPHRDVVEERHEPDAERVQQPVDEQHDREDRRSSRSARSRRPTAMFRNALMKNARPKSMPAVTATWPTKLNQPTNQLQAAGLPPDSGASLAAQ